MIEQAREASVNVKKERSSSKSKTTTEAHYNPHRITNT